MKPRIKHLKWAVSHTDGGLQLHQEAVVECCGKDATVTEGTWGASTYYTLRCGHEIEVDWAYWMQLPNRVNKGHM